MSYLQSLACRCIFHGYRSMCQPFLRMAQVKKLKKIVRINRQMIEIKLFICALSKTTLNFRLVSTIYVAFIFPFTMYVYTRISKYFCSLWFPKQFMEDYLNVIPSEARRVKVFHQDYYGKLDVFLQMVKDGQAVITRGLTKIVKAFHMEKGAIWVFCFFTFDNNSYIFRLSLYRL